MHAQHVLPLLNRDAPAPVRNFLSGKPNEVLHIRPLEMPFSVTL